MLIERLTVNMGNEAKLHIEVYDVNLPFDQLKTGDMRCCVVDDRLELDVFVDKNTGWLNTPGDDNMQDAIVAAVYNARPEADIIVRVLENDPDYQGE